ncbi:ATP-dependent DNA/RNA helicase [Neopestalotiopsis sp. 37M]|nr:ATP-dependent DNA/RNA helicase [Neopestalotiopsis sp. 37M]
MKRKLDENDAPSVEVAEADKKEPSFADFNLEPRLLQAIASQRFKTPTTVQQKTIPLALEGRDIIAKARTGSGKTAAYALPVLEAILKKKKQATTPSTAALFLVPTRELADQVTTVLESFTSFCSKEIQIVKLSDRVPDAVSKSLLSNSPDIVVATPARAWHNVKNSALSLDNLTHLVLDEADLVLSYGYDDDLQSIAGVIPKGIQTILMSATLTTEVDTLKGIFCRNPTLLDLEDEAEEDNLSQFVVKCAEDEKFLLTYVMYKLQLIKGKSIIFVADVDRSYRLKLFFEQFGIRSCILNSELPVNSRLHVVSEFNRNVYDIIIASDENEVIGDEETPVQEDADEDGETTGKTKKAEAPPKKKKRKSPKDQEYGVSRGIDFRNVSCVVNFDLPTSARSYTHRIGRTARASQSGMALSFVVPKDQYRKHMPTTVETAENDEKVLAKIMKQQQKKGREIKPYAFDMKQVNNFRYRMNDALRAVTSVAVREARVRELRQELAKSEKLKRYFEEKPQELSHLVRHDTEMRTARTQSHLKQVPDYLLPEGKKALTANEIGFVPFKKDGKSKKGKAFRGKGRKVGTRRMDPLKSFRGRPKSKK